MRVPFLDLKKHHDPIRSEIMAAINEVVDQNAFAGGSFVANFENEYAKFCGTQHCAGVGNGTDAIWIALLALGVGSGDEVITAPMTFMATAEAITYTGATPVFVDIDPGTYTIDVAQLESAITPRTKAIIPVHLFGQCADMDPILSLARKHGIFVIEDGAQSQGATYRGKASGSMGHAGATSFYPGKNLGAWGEAGAITTNDTALHDRMRMYREHGQKRKYYHDVVGWNARMDGIQAAVLSVKLKYLTRANDGRRRAAALYNQLLADMHDVALPAEASYAKHVYHVYAVRIKNRDVVLKQMNDRGIGCGIHYPVPVHLQEAYRHLGRLRGSFPVAETCADEYLSLPMFPELTDEQIHLAATEFKEALLASLPTSVSRH